MAKNHCQKGWPSLALFWVFGGTFLGYGVLYILSLVSGFHAFSILFSCREGGHVFTQSRTPPPLPPLRPRLWSRPRTYGQRTLPPCWSPHRTRRRCRSGPSTWSVR
jgi:hypothetical protein